MSNSLSDRCSERVTVRKVKVEENGKKAVFLNPEGVEYIRTKIDGCLIQGQTACDWMVHCDSHGGVLIELKGKDVDRALEQLAASFDFVVNSGDRPIALAGLIVCSGMPKHPGFDTKLQRARQRFFRAYRAPVHIVTGNHEYRLPSVLSFKGPFC